MLVSSDAKGSPRSGARGNCGVFKAGAGKWTQVFKAVPAPTAEPSLQPCHTLFTFISWKENLRPRGDKCFVLAAVSQRTEVELILWFSVWFSLLYSRCYPLWGSVWISEGWTHTHTEQMGILWTAAWEVASSGNATSLQLGRTSQRLIHCSPQHQGSRSTSQQGVPHYHHAYWL